MLVNLHSLVMMEPAELEGVQSDTQGVTPVEAKNLQLNEKIK